MSKEKSVSRYLYMVIVAGAVFVFAGLVTNGGGWIHLLIGSLLALGAFLVLIGALMGLFGRVRSVSTR